MPASGADDAWRETAAAVLAQYPFVARRLQRIPQGLINLTIAVTADGGRRYVLQRLHPVFTDAVNANLALVTAHLERRGLLTPKLVPTTTGALSVEQADGLWRVLTFVEGRAFDRLETPAAARSAGALLARFHIALLDCDAELASDRPPVHDLARHRANLAAALSRAADHPARGEAEALADSIERALAALPAFTPGPPRLVHGDPKISNVLFAPDGSEARCLIDLDTLARMPLAHELGDAMRSWCNPCGEDDPAAHFDLALFAAAMAGYRAAAGPAIAPAEIACVVAATRCIQLELACRFLADAIEERYFAWDPARFPSRSAHNLARTRAQLAAEASLAAQHDAALAARG